jgi:hypothetical protein
VRQISGQSFGGADGLVGTNQSIFCGLVHNQSDRTRIVVRQTEALTQALVRHCSRAVHDALAERMMLASTKTNKSAQVYFSRFRDLQYKGKVLPNKPEPQNPA